MNPLEEVKTMWMTLAAMQGRLNHFTLYDPTLGLEECESTLSYLIKLLEDWIKEEEGNEDK